MMNIGTNNFMQKRETYF